MKFLINILATIGLVIFCFQSVSACSCGISPPPCSEYAESEAVFVGKVIKISEVTEENLYQNIEVEVIQNFKGVESKKVWTSIGQTSCDYEDFEVGKTFLIYGNLGREDKTYFGTSYCSRTREYKEDLSDFKFLNQIDSSKPFFLISGLIKKGYDNPLTGIKARVEDNKKQIVGKSDEDGNFDIKVSKEGKYKVTVYPPKGTMFVDFDFGSSFYLIRNHYEILKDFGFVKKPFVEYEIEVKANNCGWFYLPLQDYKEDEEELDENNNR